MNLSNYYQILDQINICGIPLNQSADQKKVNFSLLEFVNDCNDELYHAEEYSLSIDKQKLEALAYLNDNSPFAVTVLVINCNYLEREEAENIIRHSHDVCSGDISLMFTNGEKQSFNLNSEDSYEGKIIQRYSFEEFLAELDKTNFINNHWVAATLSSEPSINQSLPIDLDW